MDGLCQKGTQIIDTKMALYVSNYKAHYLKLVQANGTAMERTGNELLWLTAS